MELSTLSTLVESLGISASILILGIFIFWQLSKWLKTQFEANLTERKENADKYLVSTIETNVALIELQKATNLILEKSITAVENNAKTMNNFSTHISLAIKK